MLKARDLPEPDEEIVVSFQLPPSRIIYRQKGIVVWVASSTGPNTPRGMGIRFLNMRAEDERYIAQYVEDSIPSDRYDGAGESK